MRTNIQTSSKFHSNLAINKEQIIKQINKKCSDTLNGWETEGSAVFLKNKLVLSTETFDSSGLVYNKKVFNTKNWEFEIDLNIDNLKKSNSAQGSFFIYLLKDNPQATTEDFAKGLHQMFEGLMIEVKENSFNMRKNRKKEKFHTITGIVTDSDYIMINDKSKSTCNKKFSDVIIKLKYQDGSLEVSTKNPQEKGFNKCFSLQANLNYDGYVFLAANSGKTVSNHHYVKSIQVVDLDQQVEIEDYQQEQKKLQKDQEFQQKGKDLLSVKGDHFKNVNMTLESYNRQLIRHTNVYSNLMADFIKNLEKQLELLSSIPKDHSVVDIWKSIMNFQTSVDKTTEVFKQINTDNEKKLKVNQKIQKQVKKLENTDKFNEEQEKLDNTLQNVLQLLNKKYDQFVKDKYIESLKNFDLNSISSEKQDFNQDKAQRQLERQLRQLVVKSQDSVQSKLQKDDYLDLIIIIALAFVIAFGVGMWSKLRDQQKTLLI